MTILLYGAYGYTGLRIARHAAELGDALDADILLSGRDPERLDAVARATAFPADPVSLDDERGLHDLVARADVVLHCAGPFIHTARPMLEACLRTGTHYTDITGEIQVFEMAHDLHDRAVEASVVLIPGVGMDVVPSDCLAAKLAERCPDATELELAFASDVAGISPGTAKTMVENLGSNGAARIDGRIEPVPNAWKVRRIDFGPFSTTCMTIPWGDVSTAYYSTGIPDITVFTGVGRSTATWVRRLRPVSGLMGWRPIRSLLQSLIDRRVDGPGDEVLATGRTFFRGWVRTADGREEQLGLITPQGYRITVLAALESALRVGRGTVEVGFKTPSIAFGAEYITSFDDCDWIETDER